MLKRTAVLSSLVALAAFAANAAAQQYPNRNISSLHEALKDAGANQRFNELGAVTYPPDRQTPAALQAHLKAEIDKWAPLIKKAGQYAD